ncbi:YqkE family protein [Paenibacillus lycopersici]|uniref:YqkE family protein n=1 Tax=Paenibacillus lycopersici TaxID=2704462 RepID=A0A6C0FXX3_9BACL|nr:YqkE family protein [Paenibacillus lycopersici]QHT61547.1 YqkE family protein [Paenibacillus lycopersici]
MAKKDRQRAAAAQTNAQPKEEKAATLKDLLRPDVLDKLKATAQDLKSAEEKRREDLRQQQEEARKAEQKRLDNDFEYLLNNSKMDWRSNKG